MIFNKNGTLQEAMVDPFGVTEYGEKIKYKVSDGKVFFKENGYLREWTYQNGYFYYTFHFVDPLDGSTFSFDISVIPCKKEISILDDKFRDYYNLFTVLLNR